MSGTPEVRWIATLSDGTTAVEEEGAWKTVPGQRTPWVRLALFMQGEGLHLTSLRLWVDGRVVHMPRANFGKFSMTELSRAPEFYSLQYHLEADDILSGAPQQNKFVDLAAHYEDCIVHYIQEIGEQDNAWILVTEPHERLASTPRRSS